MELKTLLYTVEDGIAVVKINRPKVLNALNQQVMDDLESVMLEIKDNPLVKGAIITGEGEKAFVAGADIQEIANLDPTAGFQFALRGQRVFRLIETLSKPVIAAINGFALGGGCELAMSCTLRVASEKARLGQPEVNLGIIPGYGGTQRLARLVGKGRALDLLITGRMIDADEALSWGLVNRVVAPERLMDEAKELLKLVLSKGPLAVSYAITALDRGLEVGLEEGLRIEAELFGLSCATEDMKEGTKAFLEKRKAEFKGR